jgi:mxaD protein
MASLLSMGASAAGRLSVERQAQLNAEPEIVWKMIGGYNHLDVWHPAVTHSEMTGTGTTKGDTRVLTLGDGATITEKLLSHTGHSYSYAIEASPLPVEHYVSTIEVAPADGGGSIVRWTSTFDAKGAPDEKATAVIAGIYEAGLGRLTGYFNNR